MIDKRELEENLKEQLSDIREEKARLTKELDNLQIELKENNNGSEIDNWRRKRESLYNDLDEKGKEVLDTRTQLEKRIKKCKLSGILVFIAYALLAVGGFYMFDIAVSIVNCMITVAVGVLISVIYVAIAKAPLNRKHLATFADPNIKAYDKKKAEFFDEFNKERSEKNANNEKLNREKRNIENELRKLNESEKSVLSEIQELDFNVAYNDTILFYGKDKGNYYEIYLDGHLYDTVRGRQIVRIILSPGIHSFKVDNTNYNIDGSVIYSYTFNTRQIIAGETIAAYPIVCEYNEIKQVSGEEFQKITKTQLL